MAGLTALGRVRVAPSVLAEAHGRSGIPGKPGGWSEITHVSQSSLPSHCSFYNRASIGMALCGESGTQSVEIKVKSTSNSLQWLAESIALRAVAAGAMLTLVAVPCSLAEAQDSLSGKPPMLITEQVRNIPSGTSSIPDGWAGLADVEDIDWWPVEVRERLERGHSEAQLRDGEEERGGVSTLLYRGVGAERGAQTALLVPSAVEDEDDDFDIDEVVAAGVGFCPAWQMSSLELVMPDGPHQKPLPPGAQWPASFTPASDVLSEAADIVPGQDLASTAETDQENSSSVKASLTPVGTIRVGMAEEDPVWEVLIGGCFSL